MEIAPGRATSTDDFEVREWLQLIRSEYVEMPGLTLTVRQAMRLWNLDEVRCKSLLDALVSGQFLVLTSACVYREGHRRDEGES
jgi:hypothetical protein